MFSFYRYCKTVTLHDKILNSKLILLSFSFDLFGYQLIILTMLDIYKMLMSYTSIYFFSILFSVYFISAQQCIESYSVKDTV